MKKIALRTEDACFDNLPDYPFLPHYIFVNHVDYQPLRFHYIDEKNVNETNAGSYAPGQNSCQTILLLHGCPSWSYLYRHVITALLDTSTVKTARRILAPDFIGCGKSDKLLERTDYSYDFYVETLKDFIQQLDAHNIVLVCQDWGGPIGLRVFSEMPERFTHIIVTNTLLPNCELPPKGVAPWPGDTIQNWVQYTQQARDISISQVMQGVTLKKLSTGVLSAYDAPFPDARYKQGMLNWPSLIPLNDTYKGVTENRKTWAFLEQCTIPFLTAFSDQDPSTAAWEAVFQQRVKGAKNIQHPKILQASHMVQEDKAIELAVIIDSFMQKN